MRLKKEGKKLGFRSESGSDVEFECQIRVAQVRCQSWMRIEHSTYSVGVGVRIICFEFDSLSFLIRGI